MPWKPLNDPDPEESAAFAKAFRKRARFLVDESLGIGVTRYLREAGWNAKDVSDVGLSGHPDEDVFAFAGRDDRVLLTHDEDFLDDRAFPPHRNPGVIVLPGGAGDESALVQALEHMLGLVGTTRELWRGSKVVMAGDGTVTVIDRKHDTGAMTKTRYRFTRSGPALIWEDD
jgi:predicted nuclease of predicted toxin-antitoxin system